MALLLFNYSFFNEPALAVFGWIIAGLEAVTAILTFIRTVFRNNKKIVASLDKAIDKCEKTLLSLRQKQAEYRAVLAYEAVERGEIPVDTTAENSQAEPAAEETEVPKHIDEIPPDMATTPADGVEEIDSTAASHVEFDGESAELFAKFLGSLKK